MKKLSLEEILLFLPVNALPTVNIKQSIHFIEACRHNNG